VQDEAWKLIVDDGAAAVAEAESPALMAAFRPLLRARETGKACLVAQLGLSLDGRIATASGDSRYINGRDALCHLHRIRALADAVMVGAGTAIADDPRLTVRFCEGDNPARVVVDPSGRVPADARVWADDGARRIVVGGADGLPDGVERVQVSRGNIAAGDILARLDEIGIRRILLEGGADTLARFLDADAVDCLHLLYGRVLIGSGKIGISLSPIARLTEARRPVTATHVFPDGDFLVACEFRSA